MIEISHQQALRLLNENLDQPIAEPQWVALQAHLENCDSCRFHLSQMQDLERDVRRVMRGRWEWVQIRTPLYAARIQSRKVKITRNRQRAGAAVILTAALIVFWLLGGVSWIASKTLELRAEPSSRGGALVYQEPARPALFNGQVLIAAQFGDRSDLYLLSSGGNTENLTSGAGASLTNTDPAWSPDGEWIAYLSSSGGKNEVMVMSPGSADRFQLTAEPGVQWQGPLSWSPDGRWIAVTGVRRDQGNQSWIYLVPLDSSLGLRALAGTRGGWAPEFSPTGEQLAFLTGSADRGSVAVFTFGNSDEFATVKKDLHWTGSQAQGVRVMPGVIRFENARLDGADYETTGFRPLTAFRLGAGLDWSPDGRSLVYIGESSQGGGSGLVIQRAMDYTVSLYSDYQVFSFAAESISAAAFGAVTWMPGNAVAFLADPDVMVPVLTPGWSAPCWKLETRPTSQLQPRYSSISLGGLCVSSSLDRSSWSADGLWLVVLARNASESRNFLYAVRMPGGLRGSTPIVGTTVRISDASWEIAPGSVLRVRPQGSSLGIRPRAVEPNRKAMLVTDPDQAPGNVVFAQRNNVTSVIVSSNPDGTGGSVLASSSGRNYCPRISPDGSQVVFISNLPPSGFASDSGNEVLGIGGGGPVLKEGLYLVAPGSNTVEVVSDFTRLPTGGPEGVIPVFTGCPLWSPDGSYLAVPVTTAYSEFIAVFPQPSLRESGAQAQFLVLTSRPNSFAWTADSRSLALTLSKDGVINFVVAGLPEGDGENWKVKSIPLYAKIEAVSGLAVDPDGEKLYLYSTQRQEAQSTQVVLRQFAVEGWVEGARFPIGRSKLGKLAPGSIAWLDGDYIGFILHGRAEDRHKAVIMRFNTARVELDVLAEFEDSILNAAWSQDGSWLIFSAESGLWVLDIQRAARENAAPAWISPLPVNDLDWK